MATVAELMHQNLLQVFGRSAVVAKAQALLDAAPGFVFAPRGPVYTSAGLGALAWKFGPADGDPVATGMDIALVQDGLIATLHTVLDA